MVKCQWCKQDIRYDQRKVGNLMICTQALAIMVLLYRNMKMYVL